jgi:hypothetical protein
MRQYHHSSELQEALSIKLGLPVTLDRQKEELTVRSPTGHEIITVDYWFSKKRQSYLLACTGITINMFELVSEINEGE